MNLKRNFNPVINQSLNVCKCETDGSFSGDVGTISAVSVLMKPDII